VKWRLKILNFLLAWSALAGYSVGHGQEAMDCSMEGFVGQTGVLPLYFAGGGPEAGVWSGREGEVPDVHADAGKLHGLPGGGVLPDGQTKYCVPTLKCCSFGA